MSDIASMVENGEEDIAHFRKFCDFACSQDEIFSSGPGYAAVCPDDHCAIYSTEEGWAAIWTKWVKKKLNDGWVFLPDGRVAAPKDHDDHDSGYWPRS